jgi:hypothetical protein
MPGGGKIHDGHPMIQDARFPGGGRAGLCRPCGSGVIEKGLLVAATAMPVRRAEGYRPHSPEARSGLPHAAT